ncbi:hypothetical protein I3760_05G094100 [Carya illinoinensis]|uniref:Uncharacterized protein n=1 Tax=Carya illinoinensis TaxID=32201 RepID=A0A922JPA6_CARIL|nr:hypothetical protein I3760_05G094100 [Carya illinoinensis]KAG6712162.1 hypothetical protein I3842_05G090500 [Carya illinoinensis]
MCIAAFLWQAHPLYPLAILLNRDEYHNRPTRPLEWWEGGEILGGRDEMAGGTWLACSRNGRVAFLTNVREIQKLPEARSRGDLPVRFLQSKNMPMEFAEELEKEADQYNGFNLILVDLCSKTMCYVTNRAKEDNKFATKVEPGIHVLTNALLDSPWPKAQRLHNNFKELLDKWKEEELPVKEMVGKLMMNTIKDEDESILPHIYPPKWEYQLSSILVDADTPIGRYGTRSTSALFVKATDEVDFYERHLENELWKEKAVSYRIEKTK